VRAASYPASVTMGGAYTAGVPYHDAGAVLGEEHDWVHEAAAEVRALMAPLAPLMPAATVVGRTIDGGDLYWPSRARAAAVAARKEVEVDGTWAVRTRRATAAAAIQDAISDSVKGVHVVPFRACAAARTVGPAGGGGWQRPQTGWGVGGGTGD